MKGMKGKKIGKSGRTAKEKVKISLYIGAKEVEMLKRLIPFSSVLVSCLLNEFFKHITLDEVYSSLEMSKPLLPDERVKRLEDFIRRRVNFISAGNSVSRGRTTGTEIWERFGS